MSSYKKIIICALVSFSLCSCSAFVPTSGPSANAVHQVKRHSTNIRVIPVTQDVVKAMHRKEDSQAFYRAFGHTPLASLDKIRPGDSLELFIWEASPQLLFGSNSIPGLTSAATTTKNTALPEQIVNERGYIYVPYAGKILASGKTLNQIERAITQALRGKANYPQVMVRLANNRSTAVTVVGEVQNSQLMPLTPKKERVLDAIAVAGGVKAPVNKVTLQMTRGKRSQSMALEYIIKDPLQNIPLQPGDVITAFYQSLSFTALGAVGKNQEISFETQGITLAQALGRMTGLNDNTANPSALFIFRFEDPTALMITNLPKHSIPVIYQVNLTEPASLFLIQNFPVRDKDVIYVSNAPGTELTKFLRIVGSLIGPSVAASAVYNAI
jgi:polysaccharide export outer membrane protein